jgi:4-hydroxy-4-methyl-2-oxoglutarate aldolase
MEVAREVALHAKEVLLADMRSRRRRYDRLGMAHDESVDTDAIDRYYAALS